MTPKDMKSKAEELIREMRDNLIEDASVVDGDSVEIAVRSIEHYADEAIRELDREYGDLEAYEVVEWIKSNALTYKHQLDVVDELDIIDDEFAMKLLKDKGYAVVKIQTQEQAAKLEEFIKREIYPNYNEEKFWSV